MHGAPPPALFCYPRAGLRQHTNSHILPQKTDAQGGKATNHTVPAIDLSYSPALAGLQVFKSLYLHRYLLICM